MSGDTYRRYSFREISEMDALDADALRSLFSIEMGGQDFYNALADRVDNAEAAKLLRRNGTEEAGHARRLGRALSIKLEEEFVPTAEMLERRPVQLPDEIGAETWAALRAGEISGDAGYQRWADHEPDPAVARLLRLNGREESVHAGRLDRAIELLGDA